MDYVIGVDIGTQSTKALLVDARGRIVASHSRGYQPQTPRPLWAEQWPDVWLGAVEACIAACVEQAGVDPARIAAVAISSLYGGSGIPVDERFEPLYPCLIWMDRRAQAEVEWVRANVDLDRLFEITGNGVDSYYGYTKILWLKREHPEVWARTRYFVPPNAFVIQRLTGELAVDHSSACNIGGVYDVKARRWSDEALGMLGIDAAMMPPRLVASTDTVGGLTAPAAARLGLRPGTPVVAGGVDAAVATFAAGVTQRGHHVAMIGTSMCWGYLNQTVDARHGLVSMPHVYNGMRDLYVFGGAITAGASVTWFLEQFGQAEVAAAREAGHGDPYRLLEEGAARLPAGAAGLIFLPYLMGERSPVWDAQASGAFVGLSLTHTRAHLYRAVLEGVAYALQHNIVAGARGAGGAGALDEKLIVVGGAAQSDLWMQIIADITQRPVYTIQENVEAALGAALLAAFGVGLVDAAQAERGWVTLAPRATPRPEAVEVYRKLFDLYAGLYPALKDTMHRLGALA